MLPRDARSRAEGDRGPDGRGCGRTSAAPRRSRRRSPHDHHTVSTPLDVAREAADEAVHVLDRVGAAQRSIERAEMPSRCNVSVSSSPSRGEEARPDGSDRASRRAARVPAARARRPRQAGPTRRLPIAGKPRESPKAAPLLRPWQDICLSWLLLVAEKMFRFMALARVVPV